MSNDATKKAAIDCESNPTASLKKMFIDSTMGNRIMAGQCPVRRAVFLKPHGVAKADFIMVPGLPEQYKVGIFAHERFSAWVRFSSDTQPHAPDMKSTVGIGIKLFDVPGEKLLESSKHATTADFLLQNMNVFFVDNVDEALAEVVFAFRKNDFDNDDMDAMAAFGKIVKNYLKISNVILQYKYIEQA